MTDRCYICGEANPNVLETHHLIPRRFGGEDTDENTATLCRNCHYCIENLYNERFWKRLGAVLREGDGLDLLGARRFSRPPGGLEWGPDGELLVEDRDTFEDYVDVIRLREEGLSWPSIEDETGVASSTAYDVYQKRDLYLGVLEED